MAGNLIYGSDEWYYKLKEAMKEKGISENEMSYLELLFGNRKDAERAVLNESKKTLEGFVFDIMKKSFSSPDWQPTSEDVQDAKDNKNISEKDMDTLVEYFGGNKERAEEYAFYASPTAIVRSVEEEKDVRTKDEIDDLVFTTRFGISQDEWRLLVDYHDDTASALLEIDKNPEAALENIEKQKGYIEHYGDWLETEANAYNKIELPKNSIDEFNDISDSIFNNMPEREKEPTVGEEPPYPQQTPTPPIEGISELPEEIQNIQYEYLESNLYKDFVDEGRYAPNETRYEQAVDDYEKQKELLNLIGKEYGEKYVENKFIYDKKTGKTIGMIVDGALLLADVASELYPPMKSITVPINLAWDGIGILTADNTSDRINILSESAVGTGGELLEMMLDNPESYLRFGDEALGFLSAASKWLGPLSIVYSGSEIIGDMNELGELDLDLDTSNYIVESWESAAINAKKDLDEISYRIKFYDPSQEATLIDSLVNNKIISGDEQIDFQEVADLMAGEYATTKYIESQKENSNPPPLIIDEESTENNIIKTTSTKPSIIDNSGVDLEQINANLGGSALGFEGTDAYKNNELREAMHKKGISESDINYLAISMGSRIAAENAVISMTGYSLQSYIQDGIAKSNMGQTASDGINTNNNPPKKLTPEYDIPVAPKTYNTALKTDDSDVSSSPRTGSFPSNSSIQGRDADTAEEAFYKMQEKMEKLKEEQAAAAAEAAKKAAKKAAQKDLQRRMKAKLDVQTKKQEAARLKRMKEKLAAEKKAREEAKRREQAAALKLRREQALQKLNGGNTSHAAMHEIM